MTDETPGGAPGPAPGPGPQPAPIPDDAAIDAYLREHMGRYTHQALDAQLRAAGHSDAAIAAAWQRVSGVGPWAGPPPVRPGGGAGFLYILGVLGIVVAYGGSALLAGFGALVFSTSQSPNGSVILVIYTVAIIAAAVIAYRFLTRVERRRRGVMRMLGAIAVVAVVYVGLCGLCFGGLSAVNSL
jgi:hypothetical protein